MSSKQRNILNHLLKNWPNGTVMHSSGLRKLDVYYQLADRYVQSHWLEKIGQGAFIKAGDKVDWTGALYTLQTQLQLDVHVAAKTAMKLLGYTHFVNTNDQDLVWLFGKSSKLPAWFYKTSKTPVQYFKSNVFSVPNLSTKKHTREIEFINDLKGFVIVHFNDYNIVSSSLERAALELLSLVPQEQTLVEAKYLIEGLITLRPNVLQHLLEHCRSIKTKRLFLFLADFCQLPCLEHLKLSKINLGQGKRVIGEGGYYVNKHQLSIPKNFVSTFPEEF